MLKANNITVIKEKKSLKLWIKYQLDYNKTSQFIIHQKNTNVILEKKWRCFENHFSTIYEKWYFEHFKSRLNVLASPKKKKKMKRKWNGWIQSYWYFFIPVQVTNLLSLYLVSKY